MTVPNLILKEIYDARDEILAEYDGDLGAYIQDARQRALAPGHPMVRRRQYSVRSGMAPARDPLEEVVEQQPSLSADR